MRSKACGYVQSKACLVTFCSMQQQGAHHANHRSAPRGAVAHITPAKVRLAQRRASANTQTCLIMLLSGKKNTAAQLPCAGSVDKKLHHSDESCCARRIQTTCPHKTRRHKLRPGCSLRVQASASSASHRAQARHGLGSSAQRAAHRDTAECGIKYIMTNFWLVLDQLNARSSRVQGGSLAPARARGSQPDYDAASDCHGQRA